MPVVNSVLVNFLRYFRVEDDAPIIVLCSKTSKPFSNRISAVDEGMNGARVKPEEITHELEKIAHDQDFEYLAEKAASSWIAAGVRAEAVEPVIRFMEAHPEIDFGSPGALVHMIERSFGVGGDEQRMFEAAVVSSVSRKPTTHTAWLLNRIINGTTAAEKRAKLLGVFTEALSNPLADSSARDQVAHYLSYQSTKTL